MTRGVTNQEFASRFCKCSSIANVSALHLSWFLGSHKSTESLICDQLQPKAREVCLWRAPWAQSLLPHLINVEAI